MFGAVKNRRPWVAAVISFFMPVFGMLYLNRGRLALGYLGAVLVLVAAGFLYLPKGTHPNDASAVIQTPSFFLSLVAAIHGYVIAKHWQPDSSRGWFMRNWYWVGVVCIGFFGGLLAIRTFLYQPFNVPSASMIPTVNVGDSFLALKSAYKSIGPERGDIVIFQPVGFGNTTFFKRVIGLPGERIQLLHGTVIVNGQPLSRKRIGDFQMSCASGTCSVVQYQEVLPSGRSYHVIELEKDGPSDNTEVFVVPADSYFVLGDNRDNSADSRNDLGFIPRSRILGRVAYRYISNHHWTWQEIH